MIRKATLDDVSRIAEIEIFAKRTAYRSIFNDDKFSFGVMQVFPLVKEYMTNPALLENIIVFDDDFVRGMSKTSPIVTLEQRNTVEIIHLFIDPFFQNMGIGTKMLCEIERRCLSNEISNIILWVLEKNNLARTFYEKQGFLPTGERNLVEGTLEYAVKYSKNIK